MRQSIKGRLNQQIQQLTQTGNDPVRLRKLQDQLALLEAAERKTLELKRRLNQAAYSLYNQVAARLAKSGSESRRVRQLFLQLMLYWNNQLKDLAGDQIENWLLESKLGRLASDELGRRPNGVRDSLEQLDAQLRHTLRQYLALGFAVNWDELCSRRRWRPMQGGSLKMRSVMPKPIAPSGWPWNVCRPTSSGSDKPPAASLATVSGSSS